jgi:hypothetical protein
MESSEYLSRDDVQTGDEPRGLTAGTHVCRRPSIGPCTSPTFGILPHGSLFSPAKPAHDSPEAMLKLTGDHFCLSHRSLLLNRSSIAAKKERWGARRSRRLRRVHVSFSRKRNDDGASLTLFPSRRQNCRCAAARQK